MLFLFVSDTDITATELSHEKKLINFRYNPQDYTLDMSDSSNISNSSSSSISDDSSYFSDSAEQVICNKTPRMVPSTDRKVRLYDHDTRQRKVYDRPLGMVERVDIENEVCFK